MRGTGYRKDAWASASDAQESPTSSAPKPSPALGAWVFSGEGPAFAVWACLKGHRQSNQTPLSALFGPPDQQLYAEHHSRGPVMPVSHCHCPCLVALPDSHILTSLLLALPSSLTFKINCPLLSLVCFISILIMNGLCMGSSTGPTTDRIKGCHKAVLAVRQRWTSWRCRHGIGGNQQSPVAQLTWFWTVQLSKRSSSVMCTHWPPRSHCNISLLSASLFSRVPPGSQLCSSLLNAPLGLKKAFRKGPGHSNWEFLTSDTQVSF